LIVIRLVEKERLRKELGMANDEDNDFENELEDAYEEIVSNIKPIKERIRKETSGKARPDASSASAIDRALKNIWGRLNTLRQKFGFNTVKEEFDTFLKTRDKYLRGKSKTLGDIETETIESELESLAGRLEIFGNLEADEVRLLKAQEKPLRILGKQIDVGNYRKLVVYAGYIGGAYLGYRFIIAPVVMPALKKILSTKIKVKKDYHRNDSIQDAEFTVI